MFNIVNTAQAFMSEDQSPNKKPRLIDSMKIGTHNGSFHCDEILACFMLRQLPKYADAEVIRYTRLYCNVRDKYCMPMLGFEPGSCGKQIQHSTNIDLKGSLTSQS